MTLHDLQEEPPEVEAATRWSRLAARLIDGLVCFAPLPLLFFPCIGSLGALLGFAGILAAQVWLLVTRGQTLGKKAMAIAIIRSDGGVPPVGWLLVREFAIPLAVGILRGAVACHAGMATFAEAGVSDKG